MDKNEILLDMISFGCGSCAYAIEKMGRKIEGVDEIHVSLSDEQVRIVYHGDHRADIIRQVSEMVHRIGHDVHEHGTPTIES